MHQSRNLSPESKCLLQNQSWIHWRMFLHSKSSCRNNKDKPLHISTTTNFLLSLFTISDILTLDSLWLLHIFSRCYQIMNLDILLYEEHHKLIQRVLLSHRICSGRTDSLLESFTGGAEASIMDTSMS